jgi:hypothetical protein
MPRVNLRKLEKLEELIKGENHVELVVIDDQTGAVILTKATGKRISTRLIVRI